MSTTINAEEKDPSLSGIIITGVIVAAIGAFIGFLFLASVSPKPYKSVADLEAYLEKNTERELLDLSYFEGPTSSSRSWEKKRDVLLNGSATTVELSAGELNAWMSAKFRHSSKPTAPDQEETSILIVPGVPNFFIDADEGFFMNLPVELTIYDSPHNCMMIAQGHFAMGTPVVFEMDALHANDAAIPLFGGLGDQLMGALLKAYSQTDEFVAFQKAWEKVESVELVKSSIRLKLR